jgi:ATP-dependent DNA helicase RecG
MNNGELVALVDRLRREPDEIEWLEFKRNRYQPQELGMYLSALANGACLAGEPRGYLLFACQLRNQEAPASRVGMSRAFLKLTSRQP